LLHFSKDKKNQTPYISEFDVMQAPFTVGCINVELLPAVRVTINCNLLFLGPYSLSRNFYAYDLPAALNVPLQQYLEVSNTTYQYELNLLYSVYSIPNVVLPFFSGYLIDILGIIILILLYK
jgi:hypothetical protein